MCVSPNFVYVPNKPNLQKIDVPCGKCWACLLNRENDLVGRAMCEAATSDWTKVLTLTYDIKKVYDPLQTQIIHKRDFQNFMRSVRKNHRSRYIAAGEYGSKKGRAHFHCVLFGMGTPPLIAEKQNTQFKPWPYGHVYCETSATEKAMRYVAKYLVKSKIKKRDELPAAEWVTYSTKPLLGAEYVHFKALRDASQSYVAQSFNYLPPGYSGKKRFSFYGRAQMLYWSTLLEHFPEAWDAPKTENMERAFVRYKKYIAQKDWLNLPTNKQDQILMAEFNRSTEHSALNQKEKLLAKPLSAYQTQLKEYISADHERSIQWLADQSKARIKPLVPRGNLGLLGGAA